MPGQAHQDGVGRAHAGASGPASAGGDAAPAVSAVSLAGEPGSLKLRRPPIGAPGGGDEADASHPTVETTPIVRFENVHKAFGRHEVLRGVSFAFESGKTTVVLGPSGVGKSVILKHIVGLIQPDRGEVWFRDRRIDRMPRRELDLIRQQIGFLFQMSALFDSMTVEENVAFPLIEHTEFTSAERIERVARALSVVGLDGLQHKMPSELSGGQKKRVALARAVMLNPILMLYDEPTTGLDPVRADGINELILQLRRELGVSGIVVTHDLASARKVADHVVMIYEGVIIAQGAFSQIARSEDERVRHFLAGVYDPREDYVAKSALPRPPDPSKGVHVPPDMKTRFIVRPDEEAQQ